MTGTKLKQYQSILVEISSVEKKIKKTKDDLDKLIEGGMVVDTVTGGSGGTQHFKIEGIPSRDIHKKRVRLSLLKQRLYKAEKDRDEVEDFLNKLDDYRMKRIIQYKYFDGLQWKEVAEKIGCGSTENSLKMEFSRFIRSFE